MPLCPNPYCEHRKSLGEPAEFKSGVTTCSDCGTKLTERIPDFPSEVSASSEFVDLKTVYSAANIALVSIFKSLLEEHGIKCWVKNESLLTGIGEIPPIETWPQLCVEENDYSEAKRIVDKALTAKDLANAWKCDSCGEAIEGQFTECWNCGKSRTPQDARTNLPETKELPKSSDEEFPTPSAKTSMRVLRIFLMSMSAFFFLLANLPIKPGESDMKNGAYSLAGIFLAGLIFTYLPKRSNKNN